MLTPLFSWAVGLAQLPCQPSISHQPALPRSLAPRASGAEGQPLQAQRVGARVPHARAPVPVSHEHITVMGRKRVQRSPCLSPLFPDGHGRCRSPSHQDRSPGRSRWVVFSLRWQRNSSRSRLHLQPQLPASLSPLGRLLGTYWNMHPWRILSGRRVTAGPVFLLLFGKRHCLLQVPQLYLRRRDSGQETH